MTEYQSGAVKLPVELKVKAATAGAGAGVAIAELATWVLDAYVITPNVTGDLPRPVSVVVTLAVAAGLAWWAGWRAKHTPRAGA